MEDTQIEMAQRIAQLENQVKGLMLTVTKLYEVWYLQAYQVPRPDQFMENKITTDTTSKTIFEIAHQNGVQQQLSVDNTGDLPLVDDAFFNMTIQAGTQQEAPENVTEDLILDTSSLQPYRYDALDSKKDEVRVLSLKPNLDANRPIVCGLTTVSLDNLGDSYSYGKTSGLESFTPLSYTWGTMIKSERIIVDGHYFLVTPALHTALVHLRNYNQGKETFWWIDAICVNQEDLDERAYQVGLMTRLYKQASMVHVWLGEENEDSARAMKVIDDLAWQPSTREEEESFEYLAKPGQTHRPAGPGRKKVKLPSITSESPEDKYKNLQALVSLYQRPWFSRVWVRQEVALPDEVKVHCGAHSCDWNTLVRAASILSFLSGEYLDVPQDGFDNCFQRVLNLDETRESLGRDRDNYAPLRDLILQSRGCEATDPRDKIYAMLPLVDTTELEFTVDYRKDVREVFEEAAVSIYSNGLNYLASCRGGEPSWFPDLQKPWTTLPTAECLYPETDLNIPWDIRSGTPKITYDREDHRLDVVGAIFDEIDEMEEGMMDTDMDEATIKSTVHDWGAFYWPRRRDLRETNDTFGQYVDGAYERKEWERYVLEIEEEPSHHNYEPMRDRNVEKDPVFRKAEGMLMLHSKRSKRYNGLRKVAMGRKLMFSEHGVIALVPEEAMPGDKICQFVSALPTFVLRQCGHAWYLIGEVYLLCTIKPDRLKIPPQMQTISLV